MILTTNSDFLWLCVLANFSHSILPHSQLQHSHLYLQYHMCLEIHVYSYFCYYIIFWTPAELDIFQPARRLIHSVIKMWVNIRLKKRNIYTLLLNKWTASKKHCFKCLWVEQSESGKLTEPRIQVIPFG